MTHKFIVVLLSLDLVACSSDDKSGSAKGTVGPEGGTVELPGGATVEVPPGALEDETIIEITRVDPESAPALPDGAEAISDTYELTAEGVDRFLLPVTIRVPASLPADDTALVALGYYDDDTTRWVPGNLSEMTDTTLAVSTLHFSFWRAFWKPCGPEQGRFAANSPKAAYVGFSAARGEDAAALAGIRDVMVNRSYNHAIANYGSINFDSDPMPSWDCGGESCTGDLQQIALNFLPDILRVEIWVNAGGEALADYLYNVPADTEEHIDILAGMIADLGTEVISTAVGDKSLHGVHLNFELEGGDCTDGIPASKCVTQFPQDFAEIVRRARLGEPNAPITVSTVWDWDSDQVGAFKDAGAELALVQAYNLGWEFVDTSLTERFYRARLAGAADDYAGSNLGSFVAFALPAYYSGAAGGGCDPERNPSRHPEAEDLETAAKGLACAPISGGRLAGAAVYEFATYLDGAPQGDCDYEINDDLLTFFDGLFTPGTGPTECIVTGEPGELQWVRRAGGLSNEQGRTVVVHDDGSATVGGWFEQTANFDVGEQLTSSGNQDVFVARYAPDQTLLWVKAAGGGGDDVPLAAVGLPDGDVVIAGYFCAGGFASCTARFGAGEPNDTTLTAASNADLYVARFDGADGSLAWAKQVNAAGAYAEPRGLALAPNDGGIVVTGYMWNSVIFGPGELGQDVVDPYSVYGHFVAKYNADDGTLVWATANDGDGGGKDVVVSADGDIFVMGTFSTQSWFEPTSVNEKVLTSSGGTDAFLVRYTADGTFDGNGEDDDVFRIVTGPGDVDPTDMEIAPDGTLRLTGYFAGQATFGGTSLTASNADMFVASFLMDGTASWAKMVGGAGGDCYGEGLGILSDGSAILAGRFNGAIQFGTGEPNVTPMAAAGSNDAFFARYASDGSLMWAKRAGGTGDDDAFGMGVNADCHVYATGYFSGQATFGPGEASEDVLTAQGATDIFTAKVNP